MCVLYVFKEKSEHTYVLLFKEKSVVVVQRKIRTHLDLLSNPQSGGKNVKTFRWDQ